MAYTSVERGVGDANRRLTLSKASRNFTTQYFNSVHASGDIRIQYLHDRFSSTGGGEVVRAVAEAYATGAAAGATINAAHLTGRVGDGKTVSGALNALRATLEVAGSNPTPGGTLAAIQLDSNISTGWTAGTNDAFIRVTNTGAGKLTKLFNFEAVGNHDSTAAVVVESAAYAASDLVRAVKCVAGGEVFYLIGTTTAPKA